MALAGQEVAEKLTKGSVEQRKLGAQLLLSELLEYIIKGLGVTPEVKGVMIDHPEELTYHAVSEPDTLEQIDGLADVAYTMYWNSCAFGIPLEEAFDLVCDNNLDKFVALGNFVSDVGVLSSNQWHCGKEITWPKEVVTVLAVKIGNEFYAVGKDARGKVRKPSSYHSVDLKPLLAR